MTSHKAHNLAGWDAAVLHARRIVARAQACSLYQFADGFDNYNSASSMYETVGGSPVISSSYRRFAPPAGLPGQGLYLPVSAYVRKNMKSNQETLICKAAYYQVSAPSSATQIIGVLDSADPQCAVVCSAAGAIEVYSGWEHLGGNILLGATGPGVIATNTFYGIEVEFTVATSGSVTVWVNGTQVLALTGVNTSFDGNAWANQVQLGDGGVPCYFDDFRVWDSTGATQNAPLGASGQDSTLVTKLPSGAGEWGGWTPNGAAANWQCVDDNPPDGDTTYVSNSTTGTGGYDSYVMPSAGFTVAPVMVVARSLARKDDSATRQLAVGVWRGSGGYAAPTYTLSSSYAFIDTCVVVDPNAGAAWTAATADAAHHFKSEIA